jgi:hypothetical protein
VKELVCPLISENRFRVLKLQTIFRYYLFRRDADEQLVLAHVWNKLADVVQILTIHIFKDDWLRRQTHTLMQSQTGNPVLSNNSSTYNGFVVVT